MARSITFGGQTQYRAGGVTRVTANSLAPIGQSSTGIVGLLGESSDGAPNTTYTIDDPALAEPTFGTGPLADAVRLAFNPTNDPRIPGGAFRCIVRKVNQSTKSNLQVPGAESSAASGPGSDDTTAAGTTATAIHLATGGLTVSTLDDNNNPTGGMSGRYVIVGTESKRRIVRGYLLTAAPNGGKIESEGR